MSAHDMFKSSFSPSAIANWIAKQPPAVRLWSDRRLTLFGIEKAASPPRPDIPIRLNHWPDLEAFEQTVSWLGRDSFLRSQKERIEKGGRVYTYVEEGKLLFYGYATVNSSQSRYPYVDQVVHFPLGTALIYGGFVHPAARGRRIHLAAQQFRMADLFSLPDIRWVFSAVEDTNPSAYRSAQRARLVPHAELRTTRRFGKVHKRATRLPHSAPLRFTVGEI